MAQDWKHSGLQYYHVEDWKTWGSLWKGGAKGGAGETQNADASHALCCLDTLAPRLWLPVIISWEATALQQTL